MNTIMAILVAILMLLFSFLWWVTKSKSTKKQPPEAAWSWPLLGHLHIFRSSKALHRVLSDLSNRLGPVFTVKLGTNRALIVSNWESAMECFTTNDIAFASRPKFIFGEILGYKNCNLGFVEYGEFWRQMRKIITVDLLSNHKLQGFKDVRENEIDTAVKELRMFWERQKHISDKAEVDIKRWFRDITFNFIAKIVVGKTAGYGIEEGVPQELTIWKESIEEISALFGKIVAADLVPFFRPFDIGNDEKTMKSVLKKVDGSLHTWLAEHKQRNDVGEGDFMHFLIKHLQNSPSHLEGRPPDSVVKATCMALVVAGSDTTAITLSWALAALLSNPSAMKKCQQELDTHVGNERKVKEEDLDNLVYLNCVVKETLRMYPAAPLAISHFSTEDCHVAGYDVPANTIIIPNVWKIQRDPRVWERPNEFWPERFMQPNKIMDVRGHNFELIPFGSGRRTCPGISLALKIIKLTLATLLHDFQIQTPNQIDWSESGGLTSIMTAPLNVLIAPR